MTTLIEQAAERLQQLRQSGAVLPHAAAFDPPAAAPPVVPDAAVATATATVPAAVAAPMPLSRRVDLDLEALAAAGFVTPNAPRTRTADQYRVIKRPLLRNVMTQKVGAHANLIMVTSALAGEGKTFNSINLAMSIATEMDHTVLLVDADVARPSVLRMIGLPNGPGLLDLLEGEADMSSVLLRTNVDKLTVLPSGSPHPRATEMLASEAMRQLLAEMARRYPDRIIVFDSPPLLLTTEARVLATHMDQIVIVVHAGKTLQANVQQALATIETCPVKMMLLNQVRADALNRYGYGYGYGYGGYGYGYGHDDGQERDKAGS
jgi:protein-tyrosine kinase